MKINLSRNPGHREERFGNLHLVHAKFLSLFLHLVSHQEKKAQQKLEMQRAREEEEREMALVDNPRLRERGSLESLLGRLHLSIIDIPPDGNW